MRGLAGAETQAWRRAENVELCGVTADSRRVEPGYMFAAIPGEHSDGRSFIGDAVARGASVVLAPEGTTWPPGVPPRPLIEDREPRRRLAQIASLLAGRQPATVVAVTGTNGKTSTVEFLRQLWAASGKPAASLGTLGINAPNFETGPGLTTPDPVMLADTLARFSALGIEHAAIEASSHGLDQYRLDGIRIAAGAFTNLTRDHLDYHGTLDAYRRAKLRLFDELLAEGACAVASASLDADSLTALREIATRRRLRLSIVGEGGSDIALLSFEPRPDGQLIRIHAHGVVRDFAIPLVGRFQTDNFLVAAALAESTGLARALDLLPKLVGVRGRMELAARLPSGAAAYVDYAHTPDALERLLAALRPHAEGRLHVVFGAGGDRDRGKRPLMGAAAARFADVVIVTDDNPRRENPASIRAEVLQGCPAAHEIAGRNSAIAAALSDLAPGDVLAVAGKGHEQGQTVGDLVLPFDDVAVIRSLAGIE